MRLEEIDLTREEYKNYTIYEFDGTALIKFDDTEIIMDLKDFNKLIEERMDKIGVIDEEIIHGNIIDLTENSHSKYKIWDKYDSMYLYFGEWILEIDKRDFDRLKEDIIKKEGLAKVEFNVANDAKKPTKRETLLKELIKTMDKENSVRTKYNEENVKLSAQMNQNDVKEKLLPLAQKLNDIMTYKEKLEAQLKYGEFQ